MSPAPARLIFAFVIVINAILWSQSRYAIQETNALRGHGLMKRMSFELLNTPESIDVQDQCLPLVQPIADQCAHVQERCPISGTPISMNYLERYFCTSLQLRPLAFVALSIWLFFLFSTLGISASDFFTPNLNTLAHILGLDENVAGVTFLAFGNGSPDLFSTFSSMRAGSGNLAIGELLGAASFIVSFVVGAMCITNEFRVDRRPFLRDVGFFTVAVLFLLVILWDGKIVSWEADFLIATYITYVIGVVIGVLWDRRQERKRILVEQGLSGDDPVPVPYRDEVINDTPIAINVSLATPVPPQKAPPPNPPRIDTNIYTRPSLHPSSPRPRSRSPSPSRSHSHAQLPSFSLAGALEFAHVVNSLQREAAGPSLSMFGSPVTPYAGGHYHSHPGSRQLTPKNSFLRDHDHELDDRSPHPPSLVSPINPEAPRHILRSQSSDYFSRSPAALQLSPLSSSAAIPSIIRTSASPATSDADYVDQLFVPRTRMQRLQHVIRQISHTLFPNLHHFRTKSLLSQVVGILAVPAVLFLTLTLPVVVTPYDLDSVSREKTFHDNDGLLIGFEEEGEERALIAEEVVLEDTHLMGFNKWLMAVQCVLAPLFCVTVLFSKY
ncbi:hypothetical protein C0992_005089 [Termitomyces sp. T32_za158]|nr:hypothetical protein C0992_005089 [Termitomyces sp. T32_za158]